MSGRYEQGFSKREKLGLATEIVSAYTRARWLLWRTDLPTTVSALRSAPPHVAPGTVEERLGYRLGNAVGRTLRHLPFDSRCLMRSLVLTSILARRRIESTLVIAVSPQPRFAAHAWVEQDGVPLLAPAESPFQRIVEI
jgi:hypothetical protein